MLRKKKVYSTETAWRKGSILYWRVSWGRSAAGCFLSLSELAGFHPSIWLQSLHWLNWMTEILLKTVLWTRIGIQILSNWPQKYSILFYAVLLLPIVMVWSCLCDIQNQVTECHLVQFKISAGLRKSVNDTKVLWLLLLKLKDNWVNRWIGKHRICE